jgi:hypothetical protein
MGRVNLYSRVGIESLKMGEARRAEKQENKHIAMGYLIHPILLAALVIPVVP